MFLLYTFASIAIAIVLVTYGIISLMKKDNSGIKIAHAFFFLACIFAGLFCGMLFNYQSALTVLYSFSLALVNWVLLFLGLFVNEMCGNSTNKATKILFIVIVAADSLVLITNPINGFGVHLESINENGIIYMRAVIENYFIYHLALGGILYLFIIVTLIREIIHTSIYYRSKYYITTGVTIALFAGCLFKGRFTSGLGDISLIFLVISLITLYHAHYSSSPKTLLRKLQTFVNDNISDATLIYDKDGRLLGINERAEQLINEEIWKDARNLEQYLGFPTPESETRIEIGDSIFSIFYKPVYDSKGNFVAETFIFHDVTEMENRFEREQKLSRIDTLTGALNRKGFFDEANEFLYKNESEAGFALMISGIVNFKGVNSTYGTGVGDVVLQTIANNLKNYHHSYPMIYGRTAEGKFSILAPFDYVEEIASDLSCITVEPGDNISIHIDMCHGFIVLSDISKPLDYYYERALLALSESKKNSVSNTLEYSYLMEEKMIRQHTLVSEMHIAIREEQFFIELQPQIDMKDQKVHGCEALVRWKHPTLGRISPGEFIPLFEENGFIVNLDIYTWELAARTLKKLEEEGVYSGSISINVSQVDITSMDIVPVLERIVRDTGISREKLHVEITESACAERRDTLVSTMQRLKDRGYTLEIDDFGSGYSSLNALMHLPFDFVKLDMEFMRDDNVEGKNVIIMNSIASMIHELGAKIIVEGVETKGNVENLERFRGDIAQGYYFSRPLSIEAFKTYLKNH